MNKNENLYVIKYRYPNDESYRKIERDSSCAGFVGENHNVIPIEDLKDGDSIYVYSTLAQVVKIEKYINLKIFGYIEQKQILPGQMVEFSRYHRSSLTGQKLSENILPGDHVIIDSVWYHVESVS